MREIQTSLYVKHAKKYGTEGVIEAAIETLGPAAEENVKELAALLVKLDAIDAEATKARRFSKTRRHRLTPEQRIKRLLGIEDEEAAE